MTLTQIKGGATSVATFSTGSAEDVRYLADCIAQLAERQLEFAQRVHDGVCMASPDLGASLTDWIEEQSPPREMQCEVCASLFPGSGQVCPDCIERYRPE